jgi:hypothetical protein
MKYNFILSDYTHRSQTCIHVFLLVASMCIVACDDETTSGQDNGGEIIGGEMTAGEVIGGEVTAGEVTAGEVTAGEVTAGEVTAGEVTAGEVTAGEVMAGEVMAGEVVELPAECLERPNPPPQSAWREEALCQSAGEGLKIRHIRDPRCATHVVAPDRAPGENISLEGVVVTRVYDDKFAVQDADGGAFSGLWVYNNQRADFGIEPGSIVYIEGELIEFYTVSELIVRADGVQVIGQQPVPEPLLVSDPAMIADGGMWTEALESVLVKVEAATVTNTAPDCPRDFDMFVVQESLRIDQTVELDYTVSRADFITSVTGVLHFSFDHQKLLLASAEDLEILPCGGQPDKCETSECRVEVDATEIGSIIITEIQNNPNGEDSLREYVELYNPNASAINIDGWTLQDCGDRSVTLSGEINGRGHFVVARSLNRQENGGVDAQHEMGELFLPNGYGSVLLFDQNDALVDQVRYEPGGEIWPNRSSGEALELLEPAGDNRDGAAWVAGEDSYGDGGKGSPGRATR